MRLSEFIMLDSEEKEIVMLHEGVLIGKRQVPDTMVFLFQLYNFYVETFCDRASKQVSMYRVFDQTKLLQPYLETIVIDDVFEAGK